MPSAVTLLPLIAVAVGCASGPEAIDKRVALFLGNAEYEGVAPLRNPVNDADALAATFERLGFDVLHGTDVGKAGMDRVIEEFSAKCVGARIALVYYAGHGLQVNGRNYLVPTDFGLSGDDLSARLVDLNEVLGRMSAGAGSSIVLLDACRDNPFVTLIESEAATGRSFSVEGQRGLSLQADVRQGLTDVEFEGEFLIGFATLKNRVASDGAGDHSPWAEALLECLETPGQEVTTILRRASEHVQSATSRAQWPSIQDNLNREVYFRSKKITSPPP